MKVLRSVLLFMVLLLKIAGSISKEKNVPSNLCSTANLIGSPNDGLYNKSCIINLSESDELPDDINYQLNDLADGLQYQKTLRSNGTDVEERFGNGFYTPFFNLGFQTRKLNQNDNSRAEGKVSQKGGRGKGFGAVLGNEDVNLKNIMNWEEKGSNVDRDNRDTKPKNKKLPCRLPPGSLGNEGCEERDDIKGYESKKIQTDLERKGFYAVLDIENESVRNKLFYCKLHRDGTGIARCSVESHDYRGGDLSKQIDDRESDFDSGFGTGGRAIMREQIDDKKSDFDSGFGTGGGAIMREQIDDKKSDFDSGFGTGGGAIMREENDDKKSDFEFPKGKDNDEGIISQRMGYPPDIGFSLGFTPRKSKGKGIMVQQIGDGDSGFGFGTLKASGFPQGNNLGFREGFDDSFSGERGSKFYRKNAEKLFDTLLARFFGGKK